MIMGRGHHFSSLGHTWMIAVLVAAGVVLIVIIFWLIHRRTLMSDGLTPLEHKKLPWQEREVLSMLRQHGGPMLQSEIIDLLPGDLQDLAEVIKVMEGKGLVNRKWDADNSTYAVTAHA
jgi:DNA-binding MarR family transcriptional regulator